VNFDLTFSDLCQPAWIKIIGSFLTALIITWISIPTIVNIAKFKKLYGKLNDRSSHIHETPNLGGLAIFAGFTLAIIIFTLAFEASEIKYLLGASILILFIGLKDDILIIDPKKKFLGQVFASLLIVWPGDIRINDFHHAFGIDGISPLSAIIISLFLLVLIINGFNLIDGIDGLASAVGIIVSFIYGAWFLLTDNITYVIVAFSLAGALISFLRFNISNGKNKIFLGDTGSMLTGLIVSVLTVKFLEYELTAPVNFQFIAAPAIAVGILILPLFDTLRVFILRLWEGKSPFKGDKKHIHHMLLRLGISHAVSSIIMLSINLLFVVIAYMLQKMGSVLDILILILFAFLLSSVPAILLRKKNSDH
jgi:UDP-GlcNAc:undecaprenyl-phosphate/decaprenyl-phosphate GlcNAc-1-phosphate transferase